MRTPIGLTIETRKQTFEVVGVVDRPGGFGGNDLSSASAFDESSCRTTLQDVLHVSYLHNVTLAVAVTGESSRVSQDIVGCFASAIVSVRRIRMTSP